tara:strand:+ start:694 stop:1899 length:1206 start_codon:yes stop_codon:yes gene_type:complete
MKILFLSAANIFDVKQKNIYTDLIRKFISENHFIYIVSPLERRINEKTTHVKGKNYELLQVKTFNLQKTNVIEKGISTISIGYLFKRGIKKYFGDVYFDLILHSTPPITFTRVIKYYKTKYQPIVYLLLKDIFPQNAVDLGFFKKNTIVYKYFRFKEKQLYDISDYIGCMSVANMQYILANNPNLNKKKVEVNPNSIDLNDHFDKVNYTFPFLNKLKDKVVFVYGGNLGLPQGIDFLLDSILHCKDLENVFFLIIGSGTELEKINTWFDQHRPPNAVFVNELQKNQYDFVLQKCHVGLIFLHPDFTIPNYPSRILSYMEHKMPVICATDEVTDIGKNAENGNYGYWCKSGDLEKFKKYVIMLSEDRELRIQRGNNAYNYLKDNFVVDVSYKIILKHFDYLN